MTVVRIAQYRLLERLRSGDRGDEVYVAEDTRMHRKVALKLVRRDSIQTREQVFREARYASLISHPNVVSVYDTGEQNEICFIASELIEGETLRQRLERGRLPVSQALDVAIAITRALGAAHDVWVVHRDVRPENIVIRIDQQVKLIDFSVATLTAQAVPLDPLRERPEAVGSLGYLSPEQVRGELVDQRSDLYSLGVVLYEMLTGVPPFEGDTVIDLLASIVEADPEPLPNEIPPPVRAIVDQLLRKSAIHRFQTADDLLVELRAARKRQ